MHATIVSTKEAETRAGVLGQPSNTERLKKDVYVLKISHKEGNLCFKFPRNDCEGFLSCPI